MAHNKTIAVIGAMDSEVAQLVAALSSPELVCVGNLRFHIGKTGEKTVIVVKCGVGKVNAARCTQLLLDRFSPDYILNSGIAGALAPSLRVGDVVIATDLVQHDFDVSAFGYAKGYMCTNEDGSKPTVYAADAALSTLLAQTAQTVLPGVQILRGRVASGDVFVSDAARRAEIYSTFHALVAEMEGAAIAQTAQLGGVAFGVLRVVSDCADGNAADSCDTFEQETADRSALLINTLIQRI